MVDRGKIRLESRRVRRQEGLCICKTLEELEVQLALGIWLYFGLIIFVLSCFALLGIGDVGIGY